MTTRWRKSSRSGGVNDEACVELARFPQGIGVRDSKNPGTGALTLTTLEFAALADQIKRGALDRP